MNKAAIFIITVIVSIAGFDVYLFSTGGTADTISNQIVTWSYNYPAFTFSLGFAFGHLFWRMRDTDKTGKFGHSGKGE